MLKAVLIDSNAISRGLLNSVLHEGGYHVVGQTHMSTQGYALLQKFNPHFVCIALEQVEDGHAIVEKIRDTMPKVLIFLVSGEIDAQILQQAQARGVHGFIVKPFKADTVLKTIRNTVIAMVKKLQG